MGKTKEVKESQVNYEIAIKGLQELKGENIVGIDLRGLDNAVCDYFIVCTGTSSTHVNALAESVKDELKKTLNERPWRSEGFGNAEWIILDYVNTVIHIFQQEAREFYNLEGLWADAKINKIEE
jgi:ribosome-associated protein